MKKKSLVLLLGFALFGALGWWFLPNLLEGLRTHMQERLSGELKREVKIRKLSFELFDNLRIDSVLITNEANDTLFYVDRMDVDWGVHASLFKQHIVIEKCHVYGSILRLDGWEALKAGKGSGQAVEIEELVLSGLQVRADTAAGVKKAMAFDLRAHFSDVKMDASGAFFADLHALWAWDIHKGTVLKNAGASIFWEPATRTGKLQDLHLETEESSLNMPLLYVSLPLATSETKEAENRPFSFKIEVDSAEIALKELTRYAPNLPFEQEKLYVSLSAQGTQEKISGTLRELRLPEALHVEGPFSAHYSAGRWEAKWNVKKSNIYPRLCSTFFPFLLDHKWFEKMSQLHYVGTVGAVGTVGGGATGGKLGGLNALGRLESDFGDVDLEVQVSNLSDPHYVGTLKSAHVHLPGEKGFGIDEIGEISGLQVTFEGKGAQGGALEASLEQINYAGYYLSQLSMKCNYTPTKLDYYVASTHKETLFSAKALLKKEKKRYTLKGTLEVRDANLQSMRLTKEPLHVSGRLEVDLHARRWDNVLGRAKLDNFRLQHLNQVVREPYFLAELEQSAEGQYQASIESDLLNVTLEGPVTPWELLKKTYRDLILSALARDTEPTHVHYRAHGHFKLDILSKYAALLFTDYVSYVSPTSTLNIDAHSDSTEYVAEVNVRADTLELIYGGFYGNSFRYVYKKGFGSPQSADVDYRLKKYAPKGLPALADAFLSIKLREQNGNWALGVTADTVDSYVQIEGKMLHVEEDWHLFLGSSQVQLFRTPWSVNECSGFVYSFQKGLRDFALVLSSKEQSVEILGSIKRARTDVSLALKNFNLGQFNYLLREPWDGKLQLDARVQRRAQGTAQVTAKIEVDTLVFNRHKMGGIKSELRTAPNDLKRWLIVGSIYDSVGSGDFDGVLDFRKNTQNVTFIARKASLDIVSPVVGTVFSDMNVRFNGKIRSYGSLIAPKWKGALYVDDGFMKLTYLNTDMHVSGVLRFKENRLILDDIVGHDGVGGRLSLQGAISHGGRNVFKIDLLANVQKYHLMNTHRGDNEDFYGQWYASGQIACRGFFPRPLLSGSVSAEPTTNIIIPILDDEKVTIHPFITFVESAPVVSKKKRKSKKSGGGMPLDFRIAIQPGASCEIITQLRPIEYLRASGEGDIRLQKAVHQDLSVSGDVVLSGGSYRYNIYSFLTKDFEILSGSRLYFRGALSAMLLDIQMRSRQNVSTKILQAEAADTDTRLQDWMQVDILVKVEGELLAPGLKFDLDIPGIQQDIAFLRTLRSDDQALKRQVVSLLFLHSFAPREGLVFDGLNVVSDVGGELLAAPINTLLADMDEDLSLDIDIAGRSVGLAYKFLEGRLHLRGKTLFLPAPSIITGKRAISQYVGNWSISYLLTEDGTWRVKGYVGSLDNRWRYLRADNILITGASIDYRTRFSQWFSNTRKRKKKRKLKAG